MSRFTGTFQTTALITGIIAWVCFGGVSVAAAARAGEDVNRPLRALTMAVEYPGVEISAGEDLDMDIIFYNNGRSNEDVEIRLVAAPEAWKTAIKTYRYAISAVHVPAGEDKRITFEAQPEPNVAPGDYRFRIAARTPDGKFQMERSIYVRVRDPVEGAIDAGGVKLTTSYPVLQGPSDAEFEFSMEVDSKLDQDAVFDLFAQAPQGWQVNFKPAYESKFISSLRLKANGSSTVAVQVKPPPEIGSGTYPVNVRVVSGDAEAKAVLTVVLTGTYELEAGTLDGLLSIDAGQGKPAGFSIYVKNKGSAVNTDLSFMTFKPENWEVQFTPEKIPALDPGELQQVEVVITPYEDALVGDYSVALRVDGERTSETIEMRVTVKASAVWSWIGIGIIVAVVGGLSYLFRKMGRR